MQGVVRGVEIRGIVSAVPEHTVDNFDIANKSDDRRALKQVRLTGIRRRRVCAGTQTASDLASIAGERLFEKLGWEKDDIRIIVYVTQSGDLQRPGSAFIIQKRLGIGKDCLVFDINQGCAGYVIGLSVIGRLLENTGGRGLLFVGESNALEGNPDDHNSLLDGDAASATALEYTGTDRRMLYEHYGDGNRAHLLYCRHDGRGHMDGNAVLLFGLGEVAQMLKEFVERDDVNEDEIDYYVLHQAQKMIVDGVVQEAGLDDKKVLTSCEEYGNTSSASIPLTLCIHASDIRNMSQSDTDSMRVLMSGFGIGLSWGLVLADIDKDVIGEVIESDYSYDDMDAFR